VKNTHRQTDRQTESQTFSQKLFKQKITNKTKQTSIIQCCSVIVTFSSVSQCHDDDDDDVQ